MSSEINRPASLFEVVQAPVDGAGLYLGYRSTRVSVPATGALVEFRYVTEPPHGDALLEMRLGERVFPGLIWGSMTRWSPDGGYLVMDWAGALPRELRRTCVLVDLHQWRYVELEGFRPISIDAEGLHGHSTGGAAQTVRMDGVTGWHMC